MYITTINDNILYHRFDFASFGALADIIGYNYFPNDDDNIQLLKSLSIFGAAFVMRPLGGTIIGYIGDHVGRKKALEISVLLMLLTSFCIGILPTYHSYGYSMTSALVLLRLLQGLACGGEIVGAFIYTIEATDGINNGFWWVNTVKTELINFISGEAYVKPLGIQDLL